MKNFNIYFLLIFSVAILLGGCEDFLETDMLSGTSEENYYEDADDAATALVGCYDGLQRVWASGVSFPVLSSVLSDNCFGGTGASDGYSYQMLDEFDPTRSPSSVNVFEDNWSAYYTAIYRCNVLLQEMDDIDWGDDEDLRYEYEAETKFIRAFCYFDMIRMFGNIPLLEEPTTDNLPQADPDSVYMLIASDLTYAIENLDSDAWSQSWADDNDGRVTKWAAESLMGRVFLYYTGYYSQSTLPTQTGEVTQSQALEYLEDVITNSGHSLLDDYATLWPAASVDDYAGEGNAETIFSIKYTYTSDYDGNVDGNQWMVMYGMRGINSYPYGQGWGAATVLKSFWNTFDDEDTRKVASIISVDDEGIEDLDISGQREYTGYYVKKYSPMSDESGNSLAVNLGGLNFQIGQYQDFVAIRYADVLLMAAELGSGSAQDYFNQVRQRAYGDNYVQKTMSQSLLREERRLEFAFEGIRFWDLLRYGLSDADAAISVSGIEVYNGGTATTKSITFDTEMEGLQQIPQTEITLSGGLLQQNTGWE